MKRNRTIDLLKFIFSICVIAIHSSLFKEINTTLYISTTMGLFRIAVPFFFITSGYFYYRKLSSNQDTKIYILKLIKIFLIFEAIEILLYTPFQLSSLHGFGLVTYLWSIISVGLGGAYWYLISTIISLLILTPLWKKKRILPLLITGLCLYLVVFTNDSYSMIFNETPIQEIAKIDRYIWRWPQAGLCSSLFYLSLGAYLYEKKPIIKHLKLLLVFFIMLLVIESYLLQTHGASDANCYLSLIIFTPLLFIFVLEHPINIKFEYFGKMSLYIYMIHQIMLQVIGFIFPFLWSNNELRFLICAILTVGLSYLLSKKVKDL